MLSYLPLNSAFHLSRRILCRCRNILSGGAGILLPSN